MPPEEPFTDMDELANQPIPPGYFLYEFRVNFNGLDPARPVQTLRFITYRCATCFCLVCPADTFNHRVYHDDQFVDYNGR